ncbi:hypothetical protein PWT90_06147 [Aphanocladium album]|nr:hypothetical protein PWT90_06147 [Aphanocladium album]
MSIQAQPLAPRPPSSTADRGEEENGHTRSLGLRSPSGTAQSEVAKPRYTAKRTHAQFSLFSFPYTSRSRRKQTKSTASPAATTETPTEPREYETTARTATGPSEAPRAMAAGKQTAAAEGELVEPRERLQTNGENPPFSSAASSASAASVQMNGQATQAMSGMQVFDVDAADVPRVFDYTDLTFSPSGSDNESNAGSPKLTAKEPPVHDDLSILLGAQNHTTVFAYGVAPPITKTEPVSTPRRPRTEVQVLNNGESREYIYIDSSDDGSDSDVDTFSPMERPTLEESSFDMPSMEALPAETVQEPGPPDLTEDDPFAGYQHPRVENDPMEIDVPAAVVEPAETENEALEDDIPPALLRNDRPRNKRQTNDENEPVGGDIQPDIAEPARADDAPSEDHIPLASLRMNGATGFSALARNESMNSEDNVPIAFLRKNCARNKRQLSDDEETELSVVNKPTPTPKAHTRLGKKHTVFNSDAFDAMIYSQSEMSPPRGVSVPRPTTASRPAPPHHHDRQRYVAGNPAIHGPVERPEKWWRDKLREIRKRPNRKAWFGRATERMRWLHSKQRQEEAPKHSGNPDGRKARLEPRPAGCQRVVSFEDVSADRLPAIVRDNPDWVKACAEMRATWKDDADMQRVVERSAQKTWEHYQSVLEEDDDDGYED